MEQEAYQTELKGEWHFRSQRLPLSGGGDGGHGGVVLGERF